MVKTASAVLAAAIVATVTVFATSSALAQSRSGKGKIICWKDKSGKVVGCGDSVPPEFQDSESKELDRSGITRRTTESADVAARRKAEDDALAKQKAGDKKKRAEQQRRDSALINTFSNEKEIDLMRDRDLQVVDTRLGQLRLALKNATDRHNDLNGRIEAAEKNKRPVSDFLKDEVTRAAADMQKLEQSIAAGEQEKEETAKRYVEMKQRFVALRGGAPAAPAKK